MKILGTGYIEDRNKTRDLGVDDESCHVTQRRNNKCARSYPCLHGVCDLETFSGPDGSSQRVRCRCDSGWIGTHCDRCCNKMCHGGLCHVTQNGEITCRCHWGYGGQWCEKLTNVTRIDALVQSGDDKAALLNQDHVIAVSVFVTCALAFSSVSFLLFYLWRRRVPILIKASAWAFPFRRKTAGDDVTLKYDAFVSYCSRDPDEKFVYRQLRPRLENEEKLQLCLHHRDFVPGEAIANNIINAVQNSRHTILVISRNYLRSDWVRLEYQVAQHEMLRLRHRIVPILLDDIDRMTIDDKNLKYILKSVTYLPWPGDEDAAKEERFWTSLGKALRSNKRHVTDTL